MLKKIFLTLSTLSFLFCFGTLTLASNIGAEVKDSANKTGNTINNALNGTKDAATNAGNTINNGLNHAGQAIQNTVNIPRAATVDRTNTGSNYVATRTAANQPLNTMATAWSWTIVGITTVAIGGLIWYYMSDTNRRKLKDER